MTGSWIAAAATTALILLSSQDSASAEEPRQEVKAQRYVPFALMHVDAFWAAGKLKAVLRTDADIVPHEESNTVFVRATAETRAR